MQVQRPTVTEKDRERLAKEWQAMRVALGNAVNGWAGIENSLASLLGVLLGNSVGMVIYNCPNNTETRIKIVDRVFMVSIYHAYHAKAFTQCWAKILLSLNRAKETRNKIVHWNTTEHWVGPPKGKVVVRHVEPHSDLFAGQRDFIEFLTGSKPGAKAPHNVARKQLPGMSAHDVQDAADSFKRVSESIQTFTRSIRALNKNNAWIPSHGVALRLAERLKIKDLQIGDPTPPDTLIRSEYTDPKTGKKRWVEIQTFS